MHDNNLTGAISRDMFPENTIELSLHNTDIIVIITGDGREILMKVKLMMFLFGYQVFLSLVGEVII